MRKLASIQRIWKMDPIEEADRIELANVLGWQCVVNKGRFQPMDLAVYFEIDSFLGFAMNVIKHQSDNADEIIGATNHRKIDRDTAVFLNTAARLHLEYEEKTGGIDMCKALDNRIQKEKIISVMDYMKDEGKSETDIINKIIERFHVTKEYVLALLSPQKA